MSKFTKEETEKFIQLYPTKSISELLVIFKGKTKEQIKAKATYLKLKKQEGYVVDKTKTWEKYELKILHENYSKCTIDELLELLPKKDKKQIRARAVYDKLTKNEEILAQTINVWNEVDTARLKKMYEICTMEELKELFVDKTDQQIRTKANHLGLKKDKEFVDEIRVNKCLAGRNNIWEEKELAIVEKYYPKGGTYEVKKYLPHRSHSMIMSKANKMGLKREDFSTEWERLDVIQDSENENIYNIYYKQKVIPQ